MKTPETLFSELKELYEDCDLIEFIHNVQQEAYNQAIQDTINPSAVKECKNCTFCKDDFCSKKKFKVSVNATWCNDYDIS